MNRGDEKRKNPRFLTFGVNNVGTTQRDGRYRSEGNYEMVTISPFKVFNLLVVRYLCRLTKVFDADSGKAFSGMVGKNGCL